jgi:hypothetical protein
MTSPPGSSTVAGGISPNSVLPLAGVGLDTFLQGVVFQVLGWPDPTLVRPRWQPHPPPQPEASVDWCAVGTAMEETEGFPDGTFVGSANGGVGALNYSEQVRLEMEVSFYGPYCMAYAGVLKSAFKIGQNRDLLQPQGISFTGTQGPTRVPENINGQWVDRADVTITLTRVLARTYDIEGILSASGTLTAAPRPTATFQTP